MKSQHPIKAVSLRTGLSPHVIRVWERRYAAVSPARAENGRRYYTEKDIVRLQLLKDLTEEGHNIGAIASQSENYLIRLKNPAGSTPSSDLPFGENRIDGALQKNQGERSVDDWIHDALQAVVSLQEDRLINLFSEARAARNLMELLENYIAPLLQNIGDRWHNGEMSIAHEHFSTAVTRTFLESISASLSVRKDAPCLLVTTPSGQLHELGALLASLAARYQGWRTIYMGPSIPALEIVKAACDKAVNAVALSIVHPRADPLVTLEIHKIKELLPASVSLLVGGRAASSYGTTLKKLNAYQVSSLTDLVRKLSHIAA